MTGWAETNWTARASAWHPAAQTTAVFAVMAALVALLPGGLLDAAVSASGLPALLPPAAPPTGVSGRLALGVGLGLLAALAYAVVQWLRERRALGEPAVRPLADDRLTVRPIVARDLGPRFDDSPYVQKAAEEAEATAPVAEPIVAPVTAPAPPTPDSRIDPDSTLGDPRWRVAGAEEATDPAPTSEEVEPAPLIARGGGWDRDAPQPDAEWRAEPTTIADAPEPGNAAAQWDADVRVSRSDDQLRTKPRLRPRGASLIRVALAADPEVRPDEWPTPREPVVAEALATTDELLHRLTAAAAKRGAMPLPRPSASTGGAAEELAQAMAALKRGAA